MNDTITAPPPRPSALIESDTTPRPTAPTRLRVRWDALLTCTAIATIAFAGGVSVGVQITLPATIVASGVDQPVADPPPVVNEDSPVAAAPVEVPVAAPITPPLVNEDPVPPVTEPAPEPEGWVQPCTTWLADNGGICRGEPVEWSFSHGETLVCGHGARPAIDERPDGIGFWAYCEPALVEVSK